MVLAFWLIARGFYTDALTTMGELLRMDGDARFWQGLVELDRYLFHLEEAALPSAIESFRAATELMPRHLEAWVAFGFVLDAAGQPEQALVAFLQAHEIAPDDEEVEVFIVTLKSEAGPESAAMEAVEALAHRREVDLESLRSELVEAEMPTDSRTLLLNGFLRARNFVRSRLEDLFAKRSRRAGSTSGAPTHLDDETDCIPYQDELRTQFDVAGVPAPFRDLAPWAIRLGIGDDVCRSILMEALPAPERSVLRKTVEPHATAIHEWLDSLGETMTNEAAAFMYLLLGMEEGGLFES